MERKALSNIMSSAWGFVRRNGFTMSEALTVAWRNFKLAARMKAGIVRFYYRKVDGSIREAWGTLMESRLPWTPGTGRKQNPTVKTYFDTEKNEWRRYKTANLVSVC